MTYSVAAWCLLPNWTWRAAARQNASPAATWNQTYICFWFNASVSSHRFNLTNMATLCGCEFLFVVLSKSCTEKTKKKNQDSKSEKLLLHYIDMKTQFFKNDSRFYWFLSDVECLEIYILYILHKSTRLTCPLFSHLKHVGCPNKYIGGIFYLGRTPPIKHKTEVFTLVTVLLSVTNKTNVLNEVHMIMTE